MNKEVSKNTHVHHVATRVGTNFPYTAPEMEEAFIHVDVNSKLMRHVFKRNSGSHQKGFEK